jgi:predicted ATPase
VTVTTGIERIRIRNYRVLQDIELDGLTPVTALVGPNGSGKSTVFDALGLLSEALGSGLDVAWARRDGLAEIRSRESAGPVEIEVACRLDGELFVYDLRLDEEDGTPIAVHERLSWSPGDLAGLVGLLDFQSGRGRVRGAADEDWRTQELSGPGTLGVRALGALAEYEHLIRFLHFMGRVQLVDLDVAAMRSGTRGVRRTESLDSHGGNIAQRVEALREHSPEEWADVLRALRRYVPGLEDVLPLRLGDGSHIVRLKEAGREQPILPENISDGTLLLLGYLVALRSPLAVALLEEPENQVHPRLHYFLAEDARGAVADQVIAATHAPRFVDALRPDEVWAFARARDGHAQVRRVAEEERVVRMAEAGGALGDLWTEGYFRFGDPLAEQL